jgi:hypothetical protein
LAICVVTSKPFAEIGIEDDWSYIRSAQVLADTGHFVYNGWATAMLGWQLYLGALAIKLFGFSFLASRLSVLFIAMAAAYLLHRIFTRLGITAYNATIGTLVLMVSPLAMPLAITFHTDIPGLFCTLVALYACLRALKDHDDKRVIAWLALATVAGDLGGTARQIAWLASLVMVPSAVWLMRRRRPVFVAGVLLWISALCFVLWALHWFLAQPYSVPEKVLGLVITRPLLLHTLRSLVVAALGTPLFLLPILLGYLPRFPYRNLRAVLAVTIGLLLVIFVGFLRFRHHTLALWLQPVTGNFVSARGLVDASAMLGTRPVVMHTRSRILLTLLCWLGTLVFCASTAWGDGSGWKRNGGAPFSPRELLTLLGPFTLAYIALLLPRAASAYILDRYLLPLLVVFGFALIYLYQGQSGRKLPWISVAATLVFMLAGVAGLHDLFAMERARLKAIAEIQALGTPRDHISGGFEYDSWTQVEQVGFMTDPRIVNPPGIHPGAPSGSTCENDTEYLTPVVQPDYLLSFDPTACRRMSDLAPVVFRTWLAPYSTTIYILDADRPARKK